MKSRHSMEIKQLLQKKRLSKSRFNPQSRIVVNSPSMKQSRQIKKSQSSSSMHVERQKYVELEVMEKRYHDLYKEYVKIAEEAKKRAEMCRKQQDEICKYEKAGERDKKEIERLKSMVELINKRQNATQTVLSNNQDQQTKFSFLPTTLSPHKQSSQNPQKLKQSRARKDLSTNSKKSLTNHENDQNTRFYLQNTKHSAHKPLDKPQKPYPNLLNSKQFQSQKKLAKRYEPSKLTESMFYGNKSSIDFRKKPMHAQKGSETFIDNTMHKDMKYSRVNSPNSRFRFIPSIDIV